MMIDYPPELRKLEEETDPWLAFDPDKFEFYIKDEATQSIKDKYKQYLALLEKTYAPLKMGWM